MTEPGKKTKILRNKRARQIAITLLLLALTAFVIFRITLKAKINSRLNAIRAQGYPVTFTELEEYYSIPDTAENAADIVIEAMRLYQEPDDDSSQALFAIGRGELPKGGIHLPETEKLLVAEHVSSNEECLSLLHKVPHVEYCRYPWEYGHGLPFNMSLNGITICVRLLFLETIHRLENNQTEEAVDSILVALRLAESLSKEPMDVAQLIRLSCKAHTAKSVEYAVNR
ncbi:MAG: hypothetical protein J7M40_00845, partial [Planctomycetes bacterium]|nr:hypothetical protein [Planctomycetota bacterium]